MLAHPGALGDVELRLRLAILAPHQRHEAAALHGQVVLDAHELQQGGGHVLQLADVGIALALGQVALPADDEGHHQRALVHAVMVEVAVVIVQRLAVVGDEDDDGVLLQVQVVQLGEDLLDAAVHVGHRAVVLGDDIVRIGAAFRHPAPDVVAEGLEVVHLLHALVIGIKGVALEEHVVEGGGGQVGRVGIHVAQEQHEGLVFLGQPLQFGNRHVVQILRLVGAAVVVVRAPAGEGEVGVVAPAAGVALEAHAGGVVAVVPQDLRQHRHAVDDGLLGERHHIRAEAVPAGHHVGIAGGGGDVGGEAVVEGDAALGVLADMGRGQPPVAVVAHVVAAQAVNAEEQKIRFLGHVQIPPVIIASPERGGAE